MELQRTLTPLWGPPPSLSSSQNGFFLLRGHGIPAVSEPLCMPSAECFAGPTPVSTHTAAPSWDNLIYLPDGYVCVPIPHPTTLPPLSEQAHGHPRPCLAHKTRGKRLSSSTASRSSVPSQGPSTQRSNPRRLERGRAHILQWGAWGGLSWQRIRTCCWE